MDSALFANYQNTRQVTKATNKWAEAVDYLKLHITIPDKGRYGYSFHLGKCKACKIELHQARKIVKIMLDVETWLKREHKSKLDRGRWLTNRYKEIKEMGVDRFISSKSN